MTAIIRRRRNPSKSETVIECVARAIDPVAWARDGKYREARRKQSTIAAARAISALAGLGWTQILPAEEQKERQL